MPGLLSNPGVRESGALFVGALISFLPILSFPVIAGDTPDTELYKRFDVTEDIGMLGEDALGDGVDIDSGAFSIAHTDVSLRGNSSLDVSIGRSFSLENSRKLSLTTVGYQPEFGDWMLEIPRIETIRRMGADWTSDSDRCGENWVASFYEPADPTGGAFLEPGDFWYGNFLVVPGAGTQEILNRNQSGWTHAPGNDPATWKFVTENNWVIACETISNNTDKAGNYTSAHGDRFVAMSPSGVAYHFDHVRVYTHSSLSKFGVTDLRSRVVMYPSLVRDRFGNEVRYLYDTAGRLTAIEDNDRRIDISYTTTAAYSTIASVSADGETWTYSYTVAADQRVYLDSVTLPDGSSWQFDLRDLAKASLVYPGAHNDGTHGPTWCAGNATGATSTPTNIPNPDVPSIHVGSTPVGTISGQVTGPSGLIGTFTFGVHRRPRTGVDFICGKIPGVDYLVPEGSPRPPYELRHPVAVDTIALKQKQLSGPGLGNLTWTYSRPSTTGTFVGEVAGSALRTVDVAAPDGVTTRYYYSTLADATEGRLAEIRVYAAGQTPGSGTPIRREIRTYKTGVIRRGYSPQEDKNPYIVGYPRIVSKVDTLQEGKTFTWQATAWDAWENPATIVRSNNLGLGYSRTETLTRHYNTVRWVIGLPDTSSVSGKQVYDYVYNALAQPTSVAHFGIVKGTFDYWDANDVPTGTTALGQLKSATDGNSNTTTFVSFKRGIPERINFADGTYKQVTVNNDGTIASIRDENGNITSYQWDDMGRLARIIYPTGDTTAWADRVIDVYKSTSAAYGLPVGHWVQKVDLQAYHREIHFDALFRPVVMREYDSATGQADIFVRKQFDHANREIFASYPKSSYAAATTGVTTAYDDLGRMDSTSTYGGGTTTVSYLEGHKKIVTDPNGHTTTFHHQVFDQPGYDSVVRIEAPEDQTTVIARDVFGNMLSATQSGSFSGPGGAGVVSQVRSYVYDDGMRLCKVVDPETAQTVMDYDAAGNLLWSVTGYNGTPSACDRASVPAADRVARSYDARNRLDAVNYPDSAEDIDYGYDSNGNLTTLRVGSITTPSAATDIIWAHAYDKRNMLEAESLVVEGRPAIAFNYTYNLRGQLTQVDYPTGRALPLVPDAYGRPRRLGAMVHDIDYHESGGISSLLYANGHRRDIAYNSRNLPASMNDGVVGWSYTYDDNGNITNVNDLNPDASSPENDVAYAYDDLNRLISATGDLWGTATYAYDPLNNLRYKAFDDNGVPTLVAPREQVYEYDADNLLTGITTGPGSGMYSHTFAYDAQGNTTARNADSFAFDKANRMNGVSGVETYRYDGNGRRVKIVKAGSGDTRLMAYTSDGKLRYEQDLVTGKPKEYYYIGDTLAVQLEGTPQEPNSITPTVNVTPNHGSYTTSFGGTNAVYWYLEERAPGGSWIAQPKNTTGSQAFSGKTGGTWEYRVSACNDLEGCDLPSGVLAVGVTPVIPTTLTVPTTTQNGSYTVSWNAPASSTHYDLDEYKNGAWTNVANDITTASAPRPHAGGSYQYRVRAYNAHGTRGYTAASTVVNVLPPVPASISTNDSTAVDSVFTISWGASAGASNYTLQKRKQNSDGSWGAWSTHATPATASYPFAYRALADGNWQFQVRANTTNVGSSAWKGTVSVTVEHTPPTPTISSPMTVMTNSFTVSWTTSSGVVNHKLEKSDLVGNEWTNWLLYNVAGTSKLFLESDGSYRFRVRACKTFVCSAYSSTTYTEVGYGGGGTCSTSTDGGTTASSEPEAGSTAASDPQPDDGSLEPQAPPPPPGC